MDFSFGVEHIRFADITPCSLVYKTYTTSEYVKPTVHHHYIIFLVVEGNVIFENSKSKYFLKSNQGIIFYPDSSFSMLVPNNSNLSLITIGFYGARVIDFLSRLSINEEHPVFDYPVNDILPTDKACFQTSRLGSDFFALSLIYAIFAHTYKTAPNQKNTYVSKAIEFISQNIDKPLHVEDVSSALGISRIYLYKLFEENIGASPKDYIINYKMLNAYEMLKTQKMRISEIASAVGYSDPFTFSKAFKAKYNLSPKNIAMGKTPYVSVIDDENNECFWPAKITTERAKCGTHSLVSNPFLNVERNVVEGWLLRAGYYGEPPLKRNLDISLITNNGKSGALSFWIFVENMCNITAWNIDDKAWIRFGSSLDWDTNFQYWLGWDKEIKKEGWNHIVLPFGDSVYGHIIGNPDFKNFCSLGIILSVLPSTNVFIDDIKVIPDY